MSADTNGDVMDCLTRAENPAQAVIEALRAVAVFEIEAMAVDGEHLPRLSAQARYKRACAEAWRLARDQVDRRIAKIRAVRRSK